MTIVHFKQIGAYFCPWTIWRVMWYHWFFCLPPVVLAVCITDTWLLVLVSSLLFVLDNTQVSGLVSCLTFLSAGYKALFFVCPVLSEVGGEFALLTCHPSITVSDRDCNTGSSEVLNTFPVRWNVKQKNNLKTTGKYFLVAFI